MLPPLSEGTIRKYLAGEVERLARLRYNHDASGGLALRPDAQALAWDLAQPADHHAWADRAVPAVSLPVAGAEQVYVTLEPDGTPTFTFWRGDRFILINCLDGYTVRCTKARQGGFRVDSIVVPRPANGEHTDPDLDDCHAWLMEKAR